MAKQDDRSDVTGDILNVSSRNKPERILLLDPKEMELRGDKRIVAHTFVQIEFDDEDKLQKCVQVLRESDEHLKNRPEELKLWNWTMTFREGMTIHFGVAWYDLNFFHSRKEAWKDTNHLKDYARFGAKVDDIRVSHEILINT